MTNRSDPVETGPPTARRRVLVTGASYGLGHEVARQCLERGDEVVTLSRSKPDLTGDHTWIEVDLGDLAQVAGVVSELGGGAAFDGLVLNAALADKSRSQWSAEQVERHLRVNALSPVSLWFDLVAHDLVAEPCNVVLMGSFLQNGNVRQPAYAMSKAALWSFMRSYTMSQPIDHPVSMNMVWPGRIETPANPLRDLPAGDPNGFYSAARVTAYVLAFLDQPTAGPRGTVVDLGRS